MTETTTRPEFPSNQEFYASSPLYSEYPVPARPRLFELLFTSNSIDLFCVECNEPSVFRPIDNRPVTFNGRMQMPALNSNSWQIDPLKLESIFAKEFHCSRVDSHKLSFFIQVRGGMVSKIGQSVSLKDIAERSIREYRKVLVGDNYGEFNTAIGLASHGVGVGAFVYLRRIIEQLIMQPAYERTKGTSGWDEGLYQRSRIKERIDLLKENLPEFLVNNKELYSILSKGIHQLSENECKKYFPVVRASIELILAEMEAKRLEDEKRKEVQAQIARISGQV